MSWGEGGGGLCKKKKIYISNTPYLLSLTLSGAGKRGGQGCSGVLLASPAPNNKGPRRWRGPGWPRPPVAAGEGAGQVGGNCPETPFSPQNRSCWWGGGRPAPHARWGLNPSPAWQRETSPMLGLLFCFFFPNVLEVFSTKS